jgi:hypothetical protein
MDADIGDKSSFDTIVLAPGFGLERSLDAAATHSYWRNDQLGQPVLDGSRKEFIVSGFGDGALIDLCRLTIERYRQDTILYELFSDELEQTEQYLAAAWVDAGPPENAFKFFTELEGTILARAKAELRSRIRKDTRVILHIGGEDGAIRSISDIFGPRSSFQNRMMTFLLYRCGAFSPRTESLETLIKTRNIDDANVLRRYGPNALAHVAKMFTDIAQIENRLKEIKDRHEQAPELFWEPGSFPQYKKKGNA